MVKRLVAAGAVLATLAGLIGLFADGEGGPGPGAGEAGRVAVETADLERARIRDVRAFTGSLLPSAEFTVAPNVSGRIVDIHYDIGDRIERGAVVAELDAAEAEQAAAQARAELAVAEAQLAQARSGHNLARRNLERVRSLRERRVASASELDTAEAEAEAEAASVKLAQAQVLQREAALGAAQVRLDEHRVRADWRGADETRVVGERLVDAGTTVAANTPILSVLALDRLTAVMYVAERDYAELAQGQEAVLTSNALPGQRFVGRIARLAPAFTVSSRQARVEVAVDNVEGRLQPGMFMTVSVVVDAADDALIAPATAVVQRNDEDTVFTIADGRAHRVPVTTGIRHDDRVQILKPGDLEGPVVTLGHQLLEDGVRVDIAGRDRPTR